MLKKEQITKLGYFTTALFFLGIMVVIGSLIFAVIFVIINDQIGKVISAYVMIAGFAMMLPVILVGYYNEHLLVKQSESKWDDTQRSI